MYVILNILTAASKSVKPHFNNVLHLLTFNVLPF